MKIAAVFLVTVALTLSACANNGQQLGTKQTAGGFWALLAVPSPAQISVGAKVKSQPLP